MKIEVTQDDIKLGVPLSKSDCPIAFALSRQIRKNNCLVGDFFIYLPDSCEEIKMPTRAHKFIRDFDSGRPVQPFTFNIDY